MSELFTQLIIDVQNRLFYFSYPKTELKGWRRIVLFVVFTAYSCYVYYAHFTYEKGTEWLLVSFISILASATLFLSYLQIRFYEYVQFDGTTTSKVKAKRKVFSKEVEIYRPSITFDVNGTRVTSTDEKTEKINVKNIKHKYSVLVNTSDFKDVINERNLILILWCSAIMMVMGIATFWIHYANIIN